MSSNESSRRVFAWLDIPGHGTISEYIKVPDSAFDADGNIIEDDAIEMLSQHLITKPVFDALFEGYAFTKQNPVSKTMQKMLDLLEEQALEKETETLGKFYESVRERARGIDNAQGKQRINCELYDKFF